MSRKIEIFLVLVLGLVLAGCGLIGELPSPPSVAPAGLKASSGESHSEIFLTWSVVEGATYYEVQRADTEGGEYQPIGVSPGNSFADTVEKRGKWYWYRVRACNAAGCGPWPAPVRGYAGHPPAPENIRASDGDHPDKIAIEWEAIPGATSYQLFRDPSPQQGCQGLCFLAEVDVPRHEDAQVRAGLWYSYAVRACNNLGCSQLSAQDTGCVQPCPPLFSAYEEQP